MKTTLVTRAMAIMVAMAVTSIPAFANRLVKANATATCTGYTITVNGALLSPQHATVSYRITLTPTSGSPITIMDKLTVTRNAQAFFKGTATQVWSTYGVTLNGDYKLSGSAHLNVSGGNVVPIVFSPATLSCKPIGTCLPTSSLSILAQGSTVSSYVPKGSWSAGVSGVQVVPLEPIGPPTPIATPSVVNSCSSNSVTGQTVCTANNTDVYLITGTTLNTTLTSGSDSFTSFSGGFCQNCGVAINSSTNTAVVTIGLSTAPSASGLQFLDLSTNTFAAPIPAANQVSEDVLWDQTRNLILSPNEGGNYDLFQTLTTGTTEFANPVGFGDGDSAAEDCSTGIALSTLEFTDQLYIADLTQAVFSAGPPATWTAPQQVQTFPEFGGFGAGTSGIAVAPGSHLGIVAGEFGGNQFGALQLPSTSGSGTPGVVDYAAAVLPNTPDGNAWNQGLDPHTITAYVSPNNSKAYGVMANVSSSGSPSFLAIVDLQALLSAPRVSGTHTVDPTFDLILNGVVTYVAAQ